MSYKKHYQCRVCGSNQLIEYLNLGNLPLSNNLCNTATETPETFPLQVMLCQGCGLSQLSIVVDPELLFGHYVYRSSISKEYAQHCNDMAVDLKKQYALNESSFVVDIAGNDGCLLKEFKDVIGCRVLNIDPAKNLYKICEEKGVRMFCSFWGMEAARHLENTFWGKADLITATNVFAHVDNIAEFLQAVNYTLKPDGVLVLEFPYLIDFIENNEFDTVYYEHLSYFTIHPLVKLCESNGLTVMDVEKQDIHGGSVRVTIGHGGQLQSVFTYIQNEHKYKSIEPYLQFSSTSKKVINDFSMQISNLKVSGYKIAAFAASAKFNTLLNCAGVTNDTIDYIIDETPEKIGKYSPGTGIQILPLSELKTNPPDYLIIGSWNFKNEIMVKCSNAGFTGKYIIPIPSFKVIG